MSTDIHRPSADAAQRSSRSSGRNLAEQSLTITQYNPDDEDAIESAYRIDTASRATWSRSPR
jgi:hypothetical protein